MLKDLFLKYRQGILYLFFGVVTTVVNLLVYYLLYNIYALPGTLANSIAWIVAVFAAFLTNKPFVFQSYDWSLKVVLPEFWKFLLSRFSSGVLETLSIFIFVDIVQLDGNITKIVASVAVVIMNYLTSRFLVFKNK